jgi:hypothetical protein
LRNFCMTSLAADGVDLTVNFLRKKIEGSSHRFRSGRPFTELE